RCAPCPTLFPYTTLFRSLIDDYGAGLYPDLLFYYGVDLTEVINGNGPAPALVCQLVWRLPDTSLTVALMQGGREHFGWGLDRHLLATGVDSINLNTRLTGQFKKGKEPKFPPMPRPVVKKQKTKKKTTVKDLWQRFTSGG